MTFRDTSAFTTLDNANMGMREDFEKWATERGWNVSAEAETGWFDYANGSTEKLWIGWNARQPEIDALKAENERLRKDAERYQFLRNEDNWCDDGDAWKVLGESSHREFDEFVDAAMKDFSTTTKEE